MRYAALAALLAIAPVAIAHDFWLAPSTYRPAGDGRVTIGLMVGEHFRGEAVARNDARIERFVIRDGRGERAVGRDGEAIRGLAVVGYRSRPHRHGTMPAQRFEAYLREEGLAPRRPGSEMFSRSAKALLRGPGTSATRFDEPLGFRFEIVPQTDPHAGPRLAVRLVFDGRPLAGALVTAMHRDDPAATVRARSNDDGMVTLPIAKEGVWLVKSVHMVEAPEESGVDWESIWATLTFERQ